MATAAQQLMTPDEMAERITPAELETSCKQYKRELIMQPIEVMKENTLKYITLVPGVRNQIMWGELKGDAQLAPWSKSRKSDADYKIEGRALQVWPGNCAYDFDPMEIFQSIYGQSIMLGQSMTTHQIARMVATYFAAKIGEHLNDHIWDAKRNVSGNKTEDLFDGFDTIIASEITSEKIKESVGNLFTFDEAITSSTAVDQLKEYYRKANKHLRGRDCYMYIPESVYWAYIDDYQARHGALPYNTEFEKQTLEGSNGKCHFVVLNNMADSKYLKITTKPNLLLGTDINAQENKANIGKYESWQLTFEYAGVYGAQIRTLAPEAILVGELKDSSESQDSDPDEGEETIVVKTDVAVTFEDAVVTATMGEEPTSQTATTEPSVAVTYSSSDESVATVDAQTGALTLVGAGTALITASYAGDTTHNAASASYALTVSAQG